MVAKVKTGAGGRGQYFFAVVVMVLCLATWYALEQSTEVEPTPILQKLSQFPHQLGEYHLSNSFQSSAETLELLGVHDYIQYNYISGIGKNVNLYVGYYRAVGVEGAYHSPKNCIPGGGWGIASVKPVTIAAGLGGKKRSTVAQMLIRNGDDSQVVLYWYQNRGRIIASEYWEKFWLVRDALVTGRRDGAFVRIMTAADNDHLPEAERRAKQFAEMVLPELEHYLPGRTL